MKYKILAVDDNPINLKLLSKVLVNTNYQVLNASSGSEAIRLAEKEKPHLILLDVVMPDMDGYTVCRKLQENEQTAIIPVIFVSSKNESIDKARGLSLGAVDYLTKPYNALEINARIHTHLTAQQKILQLYHRNRELQDKLNKLQHNYTMTPPVQPSPVTGESDQPLVTYRENEMLQVMAVARPLNGWQTAHHWPFDLPKGKHLLVASAGLRDDQATCQTQQRLKSFTSGFLHRRRNFMPRTLRTLLAAILENFAPDRTGVALTFSLLFIDNTLRTILFYSVQQAEPYMLDNSGDRRMLQGHPLPAPAGYSGIVRGCRTQLGASSMLIHHLAGPFDSDETFYNRHFSSLKTDTNISDEHFINDLTTRQRLHGFSSSTLLIRVL